MAALAALTFDSNEDEFTGLRATFSALLAHLSQFLGHVSTEHSAQLSPESAGRMMLAMTLGVVLGHPLLYTDDTAPDDPQLTRHMATFTAHGLPWIPPSARAAPAPEPSSTPRDPNTAPPIPPRPRPPQPD